MAEVHRIQKEGRGWDDDMALVYVLYIHCLMYILVHGILHMYIHIIVHNMYILV